MNESIKFIRKKNQFDVTILHIQERKKTETFKACLSIVGEICCFHLPKLNAASYIIFGTFESKFVVKLHISTTQYSYIFNLILKYPTKFTSSSEGEVLRMLVLIFSLFTNKNPIF